MGIGRGHPKSSRVGDPGYRGQKIDERRSVGGGDGGQLRRNGAERIWRQLMQLRVIRDEEPKAVCSTVGGDVGQRALRQPPAGLVGAIEAGIVRSPIGSAAIEAFDRVE